MTDQSSKPPVAEPTYPENPWPALWAMVIGFFMILVDVTIVAVANPAIKDAFGADYNAVIWVTSAYLLAYAVPLLVSGRLGDTVGPKRLYLIGLTLFTLASLGCGFAQSIEMLIIARVIQGLGAGLLTPQTMTVITRTFPPHQRGAAMSLWGATAGVATLVGPIAGGVLTQYIGWEWIFFINVPVGIIALVAAIRFVPRLPRASHTFDIAGVLLSGVAIFLVTFGLQEGQSHQWATWIWLTIAGGLVVFAIFVWQQAKASAEPLVPLAIFRDRNFSVSGSAIAVMSFTMTAISLPLMFFAQSVHGLSALRAALIFVPMALATGILAPLVGKLVDSRPPRLITTFGFAVLLVSLVGFIVTMRADAPVWPLLIPSTLMGVANAFLWAPIAATATRNLPQQWAGAGSGVYNAIRQLGAVLGAAGIGALMTQRLADKIPGASSAQQSSNMLPAFIKPLFASALAQSMWLVVGAVAVGLIVVQFYVRPQFAPAALRQDAVPKKAAS